MSVATASAVLRVRLTSTISRALPRLTAAMAQAQPTVPAPMMPSFMRCSLRPAHAQENPQGARGVPAQLPPISTTPRILLAPPRRSMMRRHKEPAMSSPQTGRWPELPTAAWKDTRETLHLWTQIVGKVRLALTPWLNHSWHVALYVTARGLTTSPIPYGEGSFQIDFDFIDHVLRVADSDGA